MQSLIDAQNVNFKYNGENVVLNNISFKANQGEFIVVLGQNGCGKSTLAKHFNAIITPNEGVVYVDGIDTKDEEKIFTIRQNIGMVFQNPDNQLVATIVEDDVAFGLENIGVDPKIIRERVDNALMHVDMTDFAGHAPSQLSGGQKQRVAIAGILAMQPKCIVLDEPTAMLDPKGRKEVIKTVLDLREKHNTTIILITHFMDEAVLADRVLVMDKGDVVLKGTPKEVFSNVDKIKSLGLDVPQVTMLIHELRNEGYDLPFDILTIDECVQALNALLEGKNV